MLSFYRQRFVTGNVVLCICGAFNPLEARQRAEECFGALPQGGEERPRPAEEPPLQGVRRAHLERDLHQATLLLGVPTVHMGHPDRNPLKIIERVLGMGGSARLYQRLREQERLVYGVQTVIAQYEDAGLFAVRCACDPAAPSARGGGHPGGVGPAVPGWDWGRGAESSTGQLFRDAGPTL